MKIETIEKKKLFKLFKYLRLQNLVYGLFLIEILLTEKIATTKRQKKNIRIYKMITSNKKKEKHNVIFRIR